MDLILFGPPGAGKGTQARLLSGLLEVPHISTGDIMRAERESGSELGEAFNKYMREGSLVPDALVAELLAKRLGMPDAASGAVFDGYPRTVPQVSELDKVLGAYGRSVNLAIALEVSLEEILDRIVGRRVCLSCGHVYHVRYSPPPEDGACVSCGASKIEARRDDSEEVARKRFADYNEKTKPLLDTYGLRGVLRSTNGVGEQIEVTERLKRIVEDFESGSAGVNRQQVG